MTDAEANKIAEAVEQIVKNKAKWSEDYKMDPASAEFYHKDHTQKVHLDLAACASF